MLIRAGSTLVLAVNSSH